GCRAVRGRGVDEVILNLDTMWGARIARDAWESDDETPYVLVGWEPDEDRPIIKNRNTGRIYAAIPDGWHVVVALTHSCSCSVCALNRAMKDHPVHPSVEAAVDAIVNNLEEMGMELASRSHPGDGD